MHDLPPKVKMRARVHVDALLLRREEAARVLGVSARTLDKWVKDGLVQRLTVGSIGLFAVEDLRAFVRKLREEQSDA
jgi:excisionase family DNA binding protein